MASAIIFIIIVLILIGLISKLIKKTREVRASFRDTFGGGSKQTAENALNLVNDNMKDGLVPEWAIDEAARELTKYNLAESITDAKVKLLSILKDQNLRMVALSSDMIISQHMDADTAKRIITDRLVKLNAKNYKAGKGFTDKENSLIRQCKYSYFFAVDGATLKDAEDAVEYLVDQWKVDVEDGKIS